MSLCASLTLLFGAVLHDVPVVVCLSPLKLGGMIYDLLHIAAIKLVGKKVKSVPVVLGEQEGSSVSALFSGFCSMKRLGVFLLPLDFPAFCQVVPKAICWFPFIHLGG